MDKPLITIGIPTYNREKYLRECIQSCLEQSNPDKFSFQIVVSNNCSKDGTAAYLVKVSKEIRDNIEFVYVNHSTEILPMQNWDTCLSHARSNFFILLSDDDRLNKDFISTVCRNIKEVDDSISGIIVGFQDIDGNGNIIRTYLNHPREVKGMEFIKQLAMRRQRYRWSAFIARTDALASSKVFKTAFPGSGMFADGAGMVSCCSLGSIQCIREALVQYRVHLGNDCRRPDINTNIDGRKIFCEFTESLECQDKGLVQWVRYWCADGYFWQLCKWLPQSLLNQKMVESIYSDMERIDHTIDWDSLGRRLKISYMFRKFAIRIAMMLTKTVKLIKFR